MTEKELTPVWDTTASISLSSEIVGSDGKQAEKVFCAMEDALRPRDNNPTMTDESNPPERLDPSGTSALKRNFTLRCKSSVKRSTASRGLMPLSIAA